MPHNVGETVRMDRAAFLKALDFRGDLLKVYGIDDTLVRINEFKGQKCVFERTVPQEAARIIIEEFERRGGKTVYR